MNRKTPAWLGLTLLLSLTAACGPGFALDVVTPTVPVATVAPSVTPAPPTDTPTDAPTEAPTGVPTEAPTAEPSATPGALTDPAPLDGLVYTVFNDGLYRVDASGQLVRVFDRAEAALSPDGAEALYVDGDDIWRATLSTGAAVNLTNTPDRIEHSPRWWPARPDLVVFGSYAVGRELGFGPALFPTLVNRDGSGYQIIDEETDAWTIALSPDGHTLAYGLGHTPYLYDLASGLRTAFNPADYGLALEGTQPALAGWSIGSPAFSSDGLHMSWSLGASFEDGANNVQQVIVDLAAHTAALLHVYHLPPSDANPAPGVWSPDGQWLVYYTLSDHPADAGLWAARVTATEERYLGAGYSPIWRTAGGWLGYTADGGATILYHTDDWASTSYSGPANGQLIGW